jgi:hypothetical protein
MPAAPAVPAATPPEAVGAPPVATPVEPQASATDDGLVGSTGAIAALLLALGLGGGALFAARSRRRAVNDEARVHEPAAVPMSASTLPVFATIDDGPDEFASPAAPTDRQDTLERMGTEELASSRKPPVAITGQVASGQRASIGALPQTRAERDALLNRMAAEAPSPANPFTSRKARLRRARLIIQRLEQEQGEAAATPFDWRTYSPSARHPTPATPARVTA